MPYIHIVLSADGLAETFPLEAIGTRTDYCKMIDVSASEVTEIIASTNDQMGISGVNAIMYELLTSN